MTIYQNDKDGTVPCKETTDSPFVYQGNGIPQKQQDGFFPLTAY
jgi:hypothetical protein